jgi:hypothetical protein
MFKSRPTASRHKQRLCAGISAFILLTVCAAPCHAQDTAYASDSITSPFVPQGGAWLQAVASQSAYFDSNPLLQPTHGETVWGSITSPEAIITDKTPTTTLLSDTIFTSNNFNRSSFSSNDVHSKLGVNDQIERWGFGLQGNVDYDTTRTSELASYNLVTTPARHLGGLIAPQVSYNFLPTDKLNMVGSYATSSYNNSIFTDYSIATVTPTYSHDFDPLNTGLLSLQAQRYRATSGPSNTVDTIGPSIGWQRKITPRLTGAATVGIQETRQSAANGANLPWKTQYAFSGNLNYKGEQDLLVFNVSRNQYPFGNGTEAFLTQFSVNDTHALNKRLSVGAGAGYQTADYQSNAYGSLKSLATGTANTTYHITEHWDVGANYQYRYENLVNVPQHAQEHVALITLSWHPQALEF